MKGFNSSLERKTPLKANNGLERHTGLNPKSDKQRAKDKHWNEVTDERCYETGFICLWCGRPGQRNDYTHFDYLDGHHIIKRRFNIHTTENCYPVHRAPCHGFIDDNNIDVREYPNKEVWENRQNHEAPPDTDRRDRR